MINHRLKGGPTEGAALITALLVVLIMVALSVAMITVITSESRLAYANQARIEATYLAEGMVKIGERNIKVALANYRPVPEVVEATLWNRPLSCNIRTVGDQRVEVTSDGLNSIVQPYEISSKVTERRVPVTVSLIGDISIIPVFQYVVYYNEVLEVLPGPNMRLTGRIHSNKDIYFGAEDSSILTLDSNYVRSAGKIYMRRLNEDRLMTGSVDISVRGSDFYELMLTKYQLEPVPSISGMDSSFAGYDANEDGDYEDPGDLMPWGPLSLERWNGSVVTDVHGQKEVAVPQVPTIKRFVFQMGGDYIYDAGSREYIQVSPGAGDYAKGFYHSVAGLVIIDDKAYTNDGTEITDWPDLNEDGNPDNPISEEKLFDGREETRVTVTEINMEILNASGYFPDNGLLYAARTDSSPSDPNGIRVVNGSELAGALTVVSENPIYLWGDYNTVNKQPASFISDAWNILSNSWNDTKTNNSLPTAGDTTINACTITGVVPTVPGSRYSGGFENFPRFHENWDNKVCRLRGSFANFWESEFAQGQWIYGSDNYTAPIRDWDFDSDLLDINNLPPYTPRTVRIIKRVWSER